jgi:zinc transport system substrate-binding protein
MHRWIVGGLMGIAMLGAACGSSEGGTQKPNALSQSRLGVLTTVYPLFHFADKVAGDLADVRLLVPPGAEPHDWEPTARTMKEVQNADVIIFNGAGFEPWLDRLFEGVEGTEVKLVEATDNVELLQGDDRNPVDPHIWLDPLRAQEQVRTILDAFIDAVPQDAETLRTNAAVLDVELADLHLEFVEGLSDCALDTFFVNHAAFGYLTDRYGLQQLAISGLSPEVEPSPARMAELISTARDYGIKHILFERLISPRVAEAVARELGAQTLVLDPLEGLTDEQQDAGEDYFSVMRQNLNNLRTALQCKP